MAVKANAAITVAIERDVQGTWRFYRIAPSASVPSAPTEAEGKTFVSSGAVPSGWSLVEPSYDGTSANSLYTVDLTAFTDGSVVWTGVSKSSSYEASRQAYSEAQAAKETATSFITYIDDDTGIQVHNAGDEGNYLQMNSDSISMFRDNLEKLTLSDEEIVLGGIDTAHVTLTPESFGFWQDDETEVISINALETSWRMGNYIWVSSEDRLTLWG